MAEAIMHIVAVTMTRVTAYFIHEELRRSPGLEEGGQSSPHMATRMKQRFLWKELEEGINAGRNQGIACRQWSSG